MRFLLLLLLAGFACSGCFRRFTMSKEQVNTYFSQRSVQPVYFTIQNDSVQLFCAVTGADTLPPLLLIHGAPGAWYGSRNILADTDLQRHFQIIAVDRLGYGNSFFRGRRKAFTSIDLQVTAIHEALRLNRSGRKGIVMGSSYGGPIAAKMAIDYPDAFYHLVMLAPAIDPDKETFWWFNKYVHHGPLKWMLPRFMRRATDEKYTHVGELRKLLPYWKRLNIPVTVVQGTADRIVNPENLDFARMQLAGKQASFISLPGVTHLVRFQRADVVKHILLEAAAANQ
ncbi:MAG TPA: alpha/beta fold hydrolase [Chitinophagaceae bacterium]|jgi:pimeloyl-ACP methyl ester carboxylesterase